LGLSPAAGWFAVIVQILCLLVLQEWEEVGFSFSRRLDQDKVLAAFIIAPLLFRVLVDFYREKRCWILLALMAVAQTATHPTMLIVTALIAGIYSLTELLYARQFKKVMVTLATIGICTAVFLPIRFLENRYAFTITDSEGELDVGGTRAERLNPLPDPRFYGINPNLVDGPAFALAFTAAALALLKLRSSKIARFIFASMVVLLLAVIPYTGWLLGLIITPFHLWRVTWFTPFGVAFVFLAMLVTEAIIKISRNKPPTARFYQAFAALVAAAVLITAIQLWQAFPFVQKSLAHGYAGEEGRETIRANALTRVGNYFDTHIDGQTMILGYPVELANYLPSLSVRAKTLFFREAHFLMSQAGMTAAEAQRRTEDYKAIFNVSPTEEQRLEFMHTYDVQFVIAPRDDVKMENLLEAFPQQLCLVSEIDLYRLYRFSSDGCTTNQ
jgi:hypothetical protein